MNRTAFNALLAQYAARSVSGEGQVSWDGGVKCVMPSVKLLGKCEQDGTPTPDAPVPVRCNNGTFRATDAEGVYDGGTVQAPELLAIPGTDIRDEWDTQTGRGDRRVGKKILLPDAVSNIYRINANTIWFRCASFFEEKWHTRPSPLSSHFTRKAITNDAAGFGNGDASGAMYFGVPLTIADTLDGVRVWVQTQINTGSPITFLYPLAEPESFYSPPARLTMPRGSGQIVQTGGDAADCPITARYLTRS